MSDRQFNQYKKQLVGQINMAQEHKLNLLLGMAKSLLYFNTILSLDEVNANIQNIALPQFLQVANNILNTHTHTSLLYQPAEV